MQKTKEKAKEKKWILKSFDTEKAKLDIEHISFTAQIHPIVASLLYNRGYKDVQSVREFIGMESEMLENPFLLKDIDKGIQRIAEAIQRQEKITVYGDYDVDGVTSVCTLYLYLKSKGANIDYYIPNRTGEGYGVSLNAIDSIKENGTKLIITVDTGITATEEVDYAKTLGIDFVITDHHECRSDLPNAVAVINPHRPDCTYPFKELAGVGVVFKLISAYEEGICGIDRKSAAIKVFSEFADLVAIGTIADVMPIRDENRIIVSFGLKMIENTNRPGLMALMDAAVAKGENQKNDRRKKRAKITSGYVGFTLAPRINAAGRIRTATLAVELFLSDDFEKAYQIAEELCSANKERQAEENKIIVEAFEKISALDIDENPVIVLDADDWHHGVIGIVSSRITEKYSRPSILVSFEGNEPDIPSENAVGKGSGRSIKGMNLVDALCYCSDSLVKFGGHELAAGLSVVRSELDTFRNKINEYARLNLTKEDMIPTAEADCLVDFSDITIELAEALQILEPYGVGNPMPTFMATDVTVNEISSVSDGKHTRFSFGNGRNNVTAMYFSNAPKSLGIYNGDSVDILFNIDINEWMNRRSVQLIVKDIRLSKNQTSIIENERVCFEKIWNGDTILTTEDIVPTRDDFAVFYRFVAASLRSGIDTFVHRELSLRLLRTHEQNNIGYIKLKIIIKVLQELNLMGIQEIEDEVYKFTLRYGSSKTDLEKSNLLRRMRLQQRRTDL